MPQHDLASDLKLLRDVLEHSWGGTVDLHRARQAQRALERVEQEIAGLQSDVAHLSEGRPGSFTRYNPAPYREHK